ncbi:MAG: DNA polymerase IV [Thermoleophilia bacterium]
MIAHLDLDAFFAAVEMHRNPHLRNRPLVVGGDPDGRGVVATANYAARTHGVRSAMSCAEARRRCTDVVFIRPDIEEYRSWSERVWEVVGDQVDVVERLGLDEGYLLLTAQDPAAQARAVQLAVARRVRLSASLGVATTKVVAKIASDRDKPGGLTMVPPGTEAAFLAPLPLRALPGAGPRTVQRLDALGITTIGELAAMPAAQRAAALPGVVGMQLWERAHGIDPRPVLAQPAARLSISTEETFARDVTDVDALMDRCREMSGQVAGHLRARGRCARTVTIKLRDTRFRTVTRAHTLAAATDDAEVILLHAGRLVRQVLAAGPGPVRLLGVGVAGLTGTHQLSLFASASSASSASTAS